MPGFLIRSGNPNDGKVVVMRETLDDTGTRVGLAEVVASLDDGEQVEIGDVGPGVRYVISAVPLSGLPAVGLPEEVLSLPDHGGAHEVGVQDDEAA